MEATAILGSQQINAKTYLQIKGSFHGTGFEIKAGDCFVISRPNPYLNSLVEWKKGGGSETDFYSAFGPVTAFTFDGTPAPDAEVKKESNSQIKITVKAGVAAGTTSFDYKINSIVNPYSQIQNNVIDVLHYPNCVTTGAATIYKAGNYKPNLGSVFLPMTTAMTKPAASISPASTTKNMVGTQDGNLDISWTPGIELPKFGGQLEIYLPYWYDAVSPDKSQTVFSAIPSAVCSSGVLPTGSTK